MLVVRLRCTYASFCFAIGRALVGRLARDSVRALESFSLIGGYVLKVCDPIH
jgi:hypothetical protein